MKKLLTFLFLLASIVSIGQTNVTMTQLRAITSATPGQTFNVTDAGKQGLYRYDNTDSTTPPNTGTVVLANQGVANPRVTWNPADKGFNLQLSNGNLTAAGTLFSETGVRATRGVSSGKHYWEVTVTALNGSTNNRVGVANSSASLTVHIGANANGWAYQFGSGNRITNGTSVAYGSPLANGDVLGLALDMDAGTLRYFKNGVDLGIAYTGLTGTLFPAFSYSDNTSQITANFGATPFAYPIPSGFSALGGDGIIPGLRMKRLNSAGNFINPNTDTVNITWFGCNGTDTTFDNTDTLEMIIGWNFKRIHIPDGTFRIVASSINNIGAAGEFNRGLMVRGNTTISGNGTHQSVILMDGVVNGSEPTYYSAFLAKGDTASNITFRRFTIRGKNWQWLTHNETTSISQANAICFHFGASRNTVDSMKLEGMWGHGVLDVSNWVTGGVRQGGYNTVRNSIGQYNSKNAFNLNAPYLVFTGNYGYKNHFSLLESSTGNAIIMNNTAIESSFSGIGMGGYTDSTEANRDGQYNLIANNFAYGNGGHGFIFSGGTKYSIITNNVSYYNGRNGLQVTENTTYPGVKTEFNYIYNNTIYDNGGAEDYAGIFADANYNRFYNNNVYSTGVVNYAGRTLRQKLGVITAFQPTKNQDLLFANNNVRGHRTELGDYYFRLGQNRIWLDTSFLSVVPNNPRIRLSVEPFTTQTPYSWSTVFGSINLSNNNAYETELTNWTANSFSTVRLGYNGGADSITFITTRPPSIELGNDTTVTNLANFTLTSTASDLDGSIASYQWHIMRRPYQSVSDIVNPTSATATLDSLSYGEYYVMCEVTDNRGAKNVDYRVITVLDTVLTMTQLRAIKSAAPGQTYFVTDAGKQGLYRYDNTDNTTPPNTGTVVLANQGVPTPVVTWNPSDKVFNLALSNGNLTAAGTLFSEGGVRATRGVSSGQHYWEVTVTALNGSTNNRVGVANASASLTVHFGANANGWMYQFGNGNRINNGTSVAYGSSLANGDVIGIALDMDAGTLRYFKNGVDLGIAYTGLTGTLFPAFSYSDNTSRVTANFGATPFAYSVPPGFTALGGSGIIPGLRMKRLNSQGNYINPNTDTVMVTWFGCNGADTTFDNTDTLEAIIAGNFKRIHFPDGTYRVNGPSLNNYALVGSENRGLLIRSNSVISGNGTHRSIILMDGVINENVDTYYSLFLCNGGSGGQDTVTNITFRGFTVRGKNYGYESTFSLENPQAINVFLGADFITVDSCKFEYLYGHGVADFGNGIGTGGYSTVTNSIARYCSKNGFNMNSPYLRFTGNYGFRNKFSLLEASTGHSIITDNIAEENDFLGIAVGGYVDSVEAKRDGGYNVIANNTVFGSNSKGLSLSGGTSYSLVFNNTMYYNGDQGLILSEDPAWPTKTLNNYVFNNTVYDNGKTSGPAPIGIYVDANQNRVYNNTVYRTGTVTWRGRTFNQSYGIMVAAPKVDQMIANNNVFGSHGLGDYYLRLGNNAIWTDTGFLAGRLIRMAVEPRTAEPRTWSQVFGSLNLSSTTAYETILTGIDPNSLHTLQLQYGPSNLLDSVSLITTRPPTIELGNDTTVYSLANFPLTSMASDLDGSIASYQWHIMRRPYLSVSDIVNPTSATTTLDSLAYGEYYVMCEVTDNRGAKNVDYRVITFAEQPSGNLTLSQLRSLTSSPLNQEYFITDPGRSGMVRYDAADVSSTDNNGTVFVSGSGLRFKRLDFQGNVIDPATDTVYVTWFGANGSDTTFDNTDIFEDIIAKNFKRILIPDGTFRINGPSLNNYANSDPKFRGLMVRANQHFIGLGTHRSILIMDGVVNENTSTYYCLLNANGGGAIDTCDNVTFTRFAIRGKNYGWATTVSMPEAIGIFQFMSASHCTVDSMKFEYIYGHGHADFAQFGGKSGYTTVRNSIFRYNSKNGINIGTNYPTVVNNLGEFNHFSLFEGAVSNGIIANNIANNNNYIGISVGGYTDSVEAATNGVYNLVINNVITGSDLKGITFSGGTRLSIMSNNVISYCGNEGILTSEQQDILNGPGVYTKNNYIYNNTVFDNGVDGFLGKGIYTTAANNYFYNNTVTSNGDVVYRGKTYRQHFGILNEAGAKYSMIANNIVTGHPVFGDYFIPVAAEAIWLDTGQLSGRLFKVEAPDQTPWAWSQLSGSLNIGNPTGINTALTGIDPNSLHTIRVGYGAGLSDTLSLITTRPPTIELGSDTTVAGTSVALSGTAVDVDGTISQYQWHIMRRPFGSTSTLTNASSSTAALTNLAIGEYYVMAEVTDNRGSKGVDYRRITVTSLEGGNIFPTANAGVDQVITTPTSQVNLSGSGTDSDGTIVSFAWTKLSGTGGTITSASSATPNVTGLIAGTYTFRLIVTDNEGATDDDTVTVRVNIPPVVNAGANVTIALPVNNTTLFGSASDPDGTLSSVTWTKLNGPAGGSISSPNTAVTNITSLTLEGTYVYRLTAVDNNGASISDDVEITVNPILAISPIVSVRSVATSSNSSMLTATASDPDGTIVSYLWVQVSGPSAATIVSPSSATTVINGLNVNGNYRFRVTVTDNGGNLAIATATVKKTSQAILIRKL